MTFDFWNNPIVVSSLRVRYREGGILAVSFFWVLLLLGVGALMQYFRNEIEPPWQWGVPWHQAYFYVLIGLQFVASCGVGTFAVGASMSNEVSNRTLDFQRVAALSPRQFLLGKMLGEPIQAYLLAMASLPLAAWCWGVGVPGLTLPVLALLYVNLVTTVLLCSASALIVKVELKEGKVQGGAGWVVVWLGTAMAAVALLSMGGPGQPTAALAAGLFSPVPAFIGLLHGNAFGYPVGLFGLQAPGLLVTPLCQLGLGWLFFRVMERRLVSPSLPLLSKPAAYGLLAAVDLLAAGLLFEAGPFSLPTIPRIAGFAAAHLVASLILIGMATPNGEALASWVWRYRGRRPVLQDLALGDHSPNDLMGMVCSAIGLAFLVPLVIVPGLAQNPGDDPGQVAAAAVAAWALVTPLALMGATLGQWVSLIVKAEGTTLALILMGMTDGLVHAAGSFLNSAAVLQMSASALVASWVMGEGSLSPWPLAAVYTGVAFLLIAAWRRRLRAMEKKVDAQLIGMGVTLPGARKNAPVPS